MDHQAAAASLLAARHGAPAPLFSPPPTEADAYAIQRLVSAELGPIGGWKVGSPGPDKPCNCAPMPLSGLQPAPATLPSAAFPTRGIESEIAFVLGHDLPPRDTAYTREEVLAAIATCHPGIEVVHSNFEPGSKIDPLSNLADAIAHAAYILGAPIDGWQHIDFATMGIQQTIGGTVMDRRGNPAGDMIRLIAWLANTGAVWAGGLRAGQVITCGSWTGMTPAPAFAEVTAAFTGAAPVELGFV